MNSTPTVSRPERIPATKSYLICTDRRTGSMMLTDALRNTRIAGDAHEYWDGGHQEYWNRQLNVTSPSEYWEKLFQKGTTANGVFGGKVFWYQMEVLERKMGVAQLKASGSRDILAEWFPGLHYIFLTRRDKVRQAVSAFKAEQTRLWWMRVGEKPGPVDKDKLHAAFRPEAVHGQIRRFHGNDASWKQYFEERGIRPLSLLYEDMVVAYEQTVLDTIRWLDIPVPPDLQIGQPRLLRQADALSEELVARYHDWAQKQDK